MPSVLRLFEILKLALIRYLWSPWRILKRYRHLYLVSALLYYGFIGWKDFLTSDLIFFLFIPAFFLYEKGVATVKRIIPFIAIIVVYDSLRGLVPYFVHNVHFFEMIDFDTFIGFGQLPTVRLQHLLYHGQLQWFDFYLLSSYLLHFIAPYIVGVLIWRARPHGYWRFISALLLLSFSGFITYLLFPAAPPWMASNVGYTDHIIKLSNNIFIAWGLQNFSVVFSHLNANQTAAIPSLHAAYPFLDLLIIYRLFGKKWAIPFAIYPLSVWFGVVYLGEHYVIDVILGIIYALVAFYSSEYVFASIRRSKSAQRVTQPKIGRVSARPALD